MTSQGRTLGRIIRSRRLARGLSVAEVAAATRELSHPLLPYVSRRQIQRIEADELDPRLGEIRALAEVLKLRREIRKDDLLPVP